MTNPLRFVGPAGRFALGGTAGAFLLSANRPDDMDLGESIPAGAIAGGIAGVAIPAAAELATTGVRYGTKPAFSVGKFGGKMGLGAVGSYFSSMPAEYSRLRTAGRAPMTAGYRAYGRMGMFAMAGGAIGGMVGGTDGILPGVALGVGAKVAVTGIKGLSAIGRIPLVGKPVLALGIMGLAYAGGSAMAGDGEVAGVGYASTDGTGLTKYSNGPARRRDNLGAEGDMVFGMHNRRHG